MSKDYLLQETRPLKNNEFVFKHESFNSNSSMMTEFQRKFWNYLEHHHHIIKVAIPIEQLPTDNDGCKYNGFRLFDLSKTDEQGNPHEEE